MVNKLYCMYVCMLCVLIYTVGPGDSQRIHDVTKVSSEENEEEEEMDLARHEGIIPADGGIITVNTHSLQFLVVCISKVDGLPGFDKLLGFSSSAGLYAYASLEFAGCKPLCTSKVS